MSEREMRQQVVRALKPLHAVAVENPVRPGFPDISYADGLIELKWVRSWPSRAETALDVPHYTPQQRLFHMKRWAAGGNMFVLLQVARQWFIFDGEAAAHHLGYATRGTIEAVALEEFSSPLEILPWLKLNHRSHS